MVVACPADDFSQTLTTRETLRQQERDQRLQPRAPDARLEPPISRAEPERFPANETPCFDINRIELVGEAAAQFQWALATADLPGNTATGRCLGAGGINLLMKRIQNAIVARGYVTTRVLAAPQDLKTGLLRLTLIPGRIRAIRFAEGTDARATRWNAFPAAPGDLLDLRDIEQALDNFKRLPTAEADIQIAPAEETGAVPGESDLIVAWKQAFPWRVNLFADDSGAKATGKYQGGATFSYDHWWTLNDLFYLSLNHDLGGGEPGRHGTRGYSAHYSLPFGDWLLSLSGGKSRYYQSVPGPGLTNIYSGESHTGEIKIGRLIHRDATSKTGASLSGWLRSSKNTINDVEVEPQRRRMAGWELGLSHRRFLAAATLDGNLAYRRGTGAYGSLRAPEENFGEGTARPRLISAEAQLDLPFSLGEQRLRYNGRWRAQWNATPLVPQDRFAIGGRYSVRGFDGENSLSGDRGWFLRNDLALTLTPGHEFYLGIDHGEVGGPAGAGLIGTRLSGAVLGLRGGYKGFAWDVFAGRPLARPQGFAAPDPVLGFRLNWSP
ncbi:MAG: ShlB/FhaC/HecB family hemolysin secretion/activation protein [Gallionellaceae bacterium]|nr:ShlB/FhaC/HecB family hemolysin secretion/activation protein [Gallionellaceae bacterium]